MSIVEEPMKLRSKGWRREDTRGRLLPGRFAGLLRLLDDSLSLPGSVTVCM